MACRRLLISVILCLKFSSNFVFSTPSCSTWSKWTTCPNPTTPLAQAVATMKSELNASGCLVPQEFYSMSVESSMMSARNTLADYKKKNNITITKVRPPIPIHNTQDSSGKRSAREVDYSNLDTEVNLKRSKRQVVINGTVAPATTMKPANATVPPPPNNSTQPPPPPPNNSTQPPTKPTIIAPPPANGTMPLPPPVTPMTPPPMGKPGPPLQKTLRTRMLTLNDMCAQKMKSLGTKMDPMFQQMAERMQNTLLYQYDSKAPNPNPKNLIDLFNMVNPNVAVALKKIATLNAAQLTSMKATAAHLKTSMTSLIELYFTTVVTLMSNQTFNDSVLANSSAQFMKFSNDAANDWYQMMQIAGLTGMDMPGLMTPSISGASPGSTILVQTHDPCYVLLAMCTLVDNGQLDYALSYSSAELESLPRDKESGGLKPQDYSDTPFPEQAVAGCGYCFRSIQCCSGKFSNYLEQDINGDVCEDHSSACEVPPMADNTCDYVKTIPKPSYDNIPANISSANKKLVQTQVNQLKDRLTSLVDTSSPAMNCTKIDKLCYCCCGGYEPVLDSEGFVVCRIYEAPASTAPMVMTTKPVVLNVTTMPPTTPKPVNGVNGSAVAGSNTQPTVGSITLAPTTKSNATQPTVAPTTTNKGKSLHETNGDPNVIPSISTSPGGCFGSFKYPAECTDEDTCLYQLSWNTVSSPKGLHFDIRAKTQPGKSWTGVLLGLNSRSPQSFLTVYQDDEEWKTIDGFLDKNNGFEIRDRNVEIADSTVSLRDTRLNFQFTKTCESFIQKYNQDFCNSSIFYFAPVKGGSIEDLNNFDFAKQTVPVGPLSMERCF